MQRVMIIGSPGAGKTTLAKSMGSAIGLPVYHLDEIFWHADGSPRPVAQVQAEIQQVLAEDAYILEGSYAQTYPARLAACDTLIWLDVDLLRRCFRVWRRMRLARAATRPGQAAVPARGRRVSRIRLWAHVLLDHDSMRNDQLRQMSAVPQGVTVLHLRLPGEVSAFRKRWAPQAARV